MKITILWLWQRRTGNKSLFLRLKVLCRSAVHYQDNFSLPFEKFSMDLVPRTMSLGCIICLLYLSTLAMSLCFQVQSSELFVFIFFYGKWAPIIFVIRLYTPMNYLCGEILTMLFPSLCFPHIKILVFMCYCCTIYLISCVVDNIDVWSLKK